MFSFTFIAYLGIIILVFCSIQQQLVQLKNLIIATVKPATLDKKKWSLNRGGPLINRGKIMHSKATVGHKGRFQCKI